MGIAAPDPAITRAGVGSAGRQCEGTPITLASILTIALVSLGAAESGGDSTLARAYLDMAWERYQALDREGELYYLRQAASADPTLTVAALRYISLLRARFELVELEQFRAQLAVDGSATAACLAAVAAQPRGAVLYVETVWAAFERGDSACAPIFLAQQATGLRPRSRWEPLRAELGRMAASREPELWTGWAEYAEALAGLGKLDSAQLVLQAGIAAVRLPVDRVRLNVRVAALRFSAGDTAGGMALNRVVDAAVRRDGSPGLRYAYLRELYRSYARDEPEKDRLLDSAAALARAYGAWDLEHSALNELARRLVGRGEPVASLAVYDRLTTIADSVGAAALQAVSYTKRGRAYVQLGDRTRALLDLQVAEEAARRGGEPYLLGDALHNRAHLYESAGEYESAARAAELGGQRRGRGSRARSPCDCALRSAAVAARHGHTRRGRRRCEPGARVGRSSETRGEHAWCGDWIR